MILWFEHDLYDQLQIIQILDWFHENFTGEVELSIICTDQYLGRLSPEEWCGLLNTDTSALPFLEGAIVRLLEEYPSCSNGLSRTAEQALKVISGGEMRPGKVFGGTQELEEQIFLGDSNFWVILQGLLESNPPLIALPEGKELTLPTSEDQELTITSVGLDVLAGKINWLEVSKLDRWIG